MLDILNRIEKARGNDKLVVMSKHPELKNILLYAYNPFKKYYIKAPDLYGVGFNTDIQFGFFDALSTRDVSGHRAEEMIQDIIHNLAPNTAEVFKRILNKDLRIGISVKSINKVWPGLIPMVWDGSEKPSFMLLKGYKEAKNFYPCMAAIKKDGIRGKILDKQIISRQGRPMYGFDHILQELFNHPGEFDGELVVPGENFDTGSGLLRNQKQIPEAKYYIFDIDIPGLNKSQRYGHLYELFMQNDFTSVELIPHRLIANRAELIAFYKEAVKAGEEGLVVYNPNSLYEDKRSYDWMRIVAEKKADCEVIGFYEGKGKYEFLLGGIWVSFKGVKVKVGTGFDDDQRFEIWMNQKKYLGKIAEVGYKEVTHKGSLRQPRFKRWRFDK